MKTEHIKDVKNIHDIPNITEHLDMVFPLDCYEIGDNTQIYIKEFTGKKISLEIISDESLITKEEKLVDLITQDNIQYLSWTYSDILGNIISTYSFRPFIDNSEKNFI